MASFRPCIALLGVLYRNSSLGSTLGSDYSCVKVSGEGVSTVSAILQKNNKSYWNPHSNEFIETKFLLERMKIQSKWKCIPVPHAQTIRTCWVEKHTCTV